MNFGKVDLTNNQLVYIDVRLTEDVSNRRAFGIMFKSSQLSAIYTERVDLILDIHALRVLAINKALLMIQEIENKFPQTSGLRKYKFLIVGFEDPVSLEENLTLLQLRSLTTTSLGLLTRVGIDIELHNSVTYEIQLRAHIDNALYNYELKNDFIETTELYSSVNSLLFDEAFYQELYCKEKGNIQLIEFVNDYQKGIPGLDKRFISPLDYQRDDMALKDIKSMHEHYPFSSEKRNFDLRTNNMVIRNSEMVLVFTKSYESGFLPYPENWVIKLCRDQRVPLFLYDDTNNKWFRLPYDFSSSNLVSTKGVPFKHYKKIGVICHEFMTDRMWESFVRLIKRS